MTQSPAALVLVGLMVLAGLGALAAFRSGARGGYKAARHTQEVTRMGGNLGRALGCWPPLKVPMMAPLAVPMSAT